MSIAAPASGAAWVLIDTLWNEILVSKRWSLASIAITAYQFLHGPSTVRAHTSSIDSLDYQKTASPHVLGLQLFKQD